MQTLRAALATLWADRLDAAGNLLALGLFLTGAAMWAASRLP